MKIVHPHISTLQHISIVCDFVPNDKWSEVCACECVGEAKTDEFLPPAKVFFREGNVFTGGRVSLVPCPFVFRGLGYTS